MTSLDQKRAGRPSGEVLRLPRRSSQILGRCFAVPTKINVIIEKTECRARSGSISSTHFARGTRFFQHLNDRLSRHVFEAVSGLVFAEAVIRGPGHYLQPGIEAELGQDVADVVLHRAL